MKAFKRILASCLAACTAVSVSASLTVAEAVNTVYEAEDAVLHTKAVVSNSSTVKSDYSYVPATHSGSGYVELKGGFAVSDDVVAITVDAPASGKYDVIITSEDYYGEEARKNALYVNDEFWAYFISGASGWEDYTVEGVYLKSGKNTVSIRKGNTCEGNIHIDKITVKESTKSSDVYGVEPILSNEKSNDQTKRLMQFICDNYGEKTITGQYASSIQTKEVLAIKSATGKTPALLGFDVMNYSGSYADYNPIEAQKLKLTNSIIEWCNEQGGIASVSWHWLAPKQYIKENISTAFYSDKVTLDIKKVMNGEDREGYNLLVADIDRIAEQFKILQDNGVSILWRPLHEAGGNDTSDAWFWWGTDRDSYIQLWKLVYDRMTDYHGLNNLIWVWNGQKSDWYPGDEYCDIVAWDIYTDKQSYEGSAAKFYQATDCSTMKKVVALSENGTVPSIEKMTESNSMWSWFMTWNGSFVVNKSGALNEEYTTAEELNKLYSSDKTITLEDLPDLKTYPITYKQTTVLERTNKHVNPYEGTPDTDTDTDTDTDVYPKGDITGDRVIDILDVVQARSHIVGNSVLNAAELSRGDMDGDGKLDILDVVTIRMVIVN
ncbi:MAG: glycosyl hydrolase [Oscillospiraceae bacterium]